MSFSLLFILTSLIPGFSNPMTANPPGPEKAEVIRVFLLAGQSNMEGHAVVDLDHEEHYNGGRGNLEKLLEDPQWQPRLSHLRDKNGKWTSRDDVFVRYRPERGPLKKGPLSIGFAVHEGKHHFGPELQIGHRLGQASRDPVLLIKTCWGGRSLHVDFRPPSAGGKTGPAYQQMIREIREALANIDKDFPQLAGKKPVISGFFWFQGWNDMYADGALENYSQNFLHLVDDLRKEFQVPRLPVIIGQTGNADNSQLHAAQEAPSKSASYKGTIVYVPTRQFRYKPEDSPNSGHGHHWFGHAGSYFQVGDAMGKAMVELISGKKSKR